MNDSLSIHFFYFVIQYLKSSNEGTETPSLR